jgi:hypothetical protein
MPLHQDSGFGEPERRSFESERMRQSIESIKDLNFSSEDEARIDERLWDEKSGPVFGDGEEREAERGAHIDAASTNTQCWTVKCTEG